ncbi:hypothetical protein OR16_08492 [Cupriavidus basilensis OR16]|uniref:Uncharacterized protein n=1 Tax=Cupriavidus basilensis OR16 TaxID=1127483 RepID=H1S1Z6_9BURK|nr:hypothetical protein OR16_08492 [Cupriavidus basilensis OR16]
MPICFRCASTLLGGIELMHMLAKGQMQRTEEHCVSGAAILLAARLTNTVFANFRRLLLLTATQPQRRRAHWRLARIIPWQI